MNPDSPLVVAVARRGLRRLKWNELVRRGDFVANGHQGFEPLAGPIGFRADAFVQQVYRRLEIHPARAGKAMA